MGINHIAAKASLQPRPYTLLSLLHCSTEIMSRNYDLVKIFCPKTQNFCSWIGCKITRVLYMSSRFGLLGVVSRDFSQAEKEGTACKAEQIHKMTSIFTQNDNLGQF